MTDDTAGKANSLLRVNGCTTTEAQQRAAEQILATAKRADGPGGRYMSSSGQFPGPYNFLLRSPELAMRWRHMADYLRFETSVPLRLNELAILIQARFWTAQFEWWAHYPLALRAGLPQTVADDVKVGKRPTGMRPDEEAVYAFCVELMRDHWCHRRDVRHAAGTAHRGANRGSGRGDRILRHRVDDPQHGRGRDPDRRGPAAGAFGWPAAVGR